MFLKIKRLFLLALIVSFLPITVAQAANFTSPPIKDKTYSGKFIAQLLPDPIVLVAGETKEMAVRIKNTGKTTWTKNTANYVSAYTVNPNNHKSLFTTSSWLGADHPAKILNTTKPGQVAEVRFKITAPTEPGDYEENFYLAAEKVTWIQGTRFYFKIKVVLPPQAPVALDEAGDTSTSTTSTSELLQDEPTPEAEEMTTSTEDIFVSSTRELVAEPNIRVGLYKATSPVEFKSDFSYQVYAGGILKGELPAGTLATFTYKKGITYFKGGDLEFNLSRDAIRLEPYDFNNYFTFVTISENSLTGGVKILMLTGGPWNLNIHPNQARLLW